MSVSLFQTQVMIEVEDPRGSRQSINLRQLKQQQRINESEEKLVAIPPGSTYYCNSTLF